MTALVDVKNLHVRRDGAEILKGVSLAAAAGEFVALIGPNGAGKSTLLRATVGVEPIAEGEASLMGEPVASLAPIARARRLAYLPQARPIHWSISVERLVALGRYAYGAPEGAAGDPAVDRAISAADIGHLRRRAATTLSGGEIARAHLARALAAETPVLVADEPTAALDPKHQLQIMRALRARADDGRLILAALHDLALAARFATRVVLIESGRILADGAPGETLSAERLSAAFGVSARIARAGDVSHFSFGD